ncbi:MAG: hydroxyethylthiazole kinase [Chloroflexota bacterium]|nr:hydroxyethylthiazole kinase [Chloroflexota bacterium]
MSVEARDATAAIFARVRSTRPLVHCITNGVTVGRVADALAAVGALPVMASAAEEADEIDAAADALLLNCGTPSAARWEAMQAAARTASANGVRVVLDPVGVAASRWRRDHARGLVGVARPVVRGNALEVASLAGVAARGMARGVSALDVDPDAIESLAVEAARALGTTVLVSGPVDAVADATHARSARNEGDAPSVVGLGDVLGALVAAACPFEPDALEAAWAARILLTDAVAAARAAATGPGSFWPALIDALGATR